MKTLLGKNMTVSMSKWRKTFKLFGLTITISKDIDVGNYEIKHYATETGFDFIFDKASASGIIFSTPAFDKTEEIKRILGK
jgi:hypothetical protein